MVTDHNLREVDIAQTHFPHIKSWHGTLANASTTYTHMHTLLEASQGLCVFVCTSHMHSCVSGCYSLFSVPGAPLAASDGFSPPSFPLSPCQLSLVSRVSPFTAGMAENRMEDVRSWGGRWKKRTFQASCSAFVPSCHLKNRRSCLLDRKLQLHLLLLEPHHEVWVRKISGLK